MSSGESKNITYRSITTALLGLVGTLIGGWAAWITNDHIRLSHEHASWTQAIETLKNLELRTRNLEIEIARTGPRNDTRGPGN